MRRVLTTVGWLVIAAAVTGCSPTSGGSQSPGAAEIAPDSTEASTGPHDQFAGAWRLVRIERFDESGELAEPPVEDRVGYLMYDPAGYMGVTLMQPDRAAYAADEPTPDEALTALQTYTSYFGRFTVNESEGYVTHHLEGSFNPRGTGADNQRFYRFEENRLVLQPPVNEAGIRSELSWERMPDLADDDLTDTHRRLFGFYRIESVQRTVDGDLLPVEEVAQYDTGYIIYAPSGHMAVHLMRPGRQIPEGQAVTPAAALDAVASYASYFGPFSVHEDERYLVHHRIGNKTPSGTGTDAQRFYELTDTHLMLRPPPGIDGDGRTTQGIIGWVLISD